MAVVCALLMGPSQARAQTLELLSLSSQYLEHKEQGPPNTGEVQVTSYDARLAVPIPLNERQFLVPGLGYHMDSISFDGTGPDFIDLRSFQSIELSLMFIQVLPKNWALMVRLAPGIAGDMQDLDSGMLRFNAMALATHKFSDTFTLGFGAITSYGFGQLLPLPAVSVIWKPTPNLMVEAFVPAFARVRYTIADRVQLGVGALVNGNSYALRDDRIRGRWPCSAQATDDPATPQDEALASASLCPDNIAYSVVSAGPQVGVRLFSTVWLTLAFERTLFRRYELRNSDGDDLLEDDGRLPDGFLGRASLVWRAPQR